MKNVSNPLYLLDMIFAQTMFEYRLKFVEIAVGDHESTKI